jgi:hypothetical protein
MSSEITLVRREQLDPVVLAEAAFIDVPVALPELVCVGDVIDTESQEGFLRHVHECHSASIKYKISS